MLEDFKNFLFRGNVIDLAVAVVIGAAFKAVIDALVKDIVMPIVGIVGGKPTFSAYVLTVNGSVIRWGAFVTEIITFLIIGASLFVAIRSFEKLQSFRKAAADVTEQSAPLSVGEELLTEIRDLLKTEAGGSPAP
jgi:large conductance mechanosensitive channel